MRRRAGFTLTEVLIALFILTFGLVGIWYLFPVGIDAAGRALGAVVATNFSKAVTAEISAKNPFDATTGYDSTKLPAHLQATTDLSDSSLKAFEAIPTTDAYLAPFRLYTGYKYGLSYQNNLYKSGFLTVNKQRGGAVFLRVTKGRYNWYFLASLGDVGTAFY